MIFFEWLFVDNGWGIFVSVILAVVITWCIAELGG